VLTNDYGTLRSEYSARLQMKAFFCALFVHDRVSLLVGHELPLQQAMPLLRSHIDCREDHVPVVCGLYAHLLFASAPSSFAFPARCSS
jgi:hypothetical protein